MPPPKKLSDAAARVAVAVQFDARATVSEIARRTKLRAHTVQYQLGRLREEGTLRPFALINPFALGFEQYEVFFSLASRAVRARERLLAFLASDRRVLWYGELGGQYHYAFTISVRGTAEAFAFLEELSTRFGVAFQNRLTAALVSLRLFRKRYLAPALAGKGEESVLLTRPTETAALDALDTKLIQQLRKLPGASHRELAAALGSPRTTVDARMASLERRGVLVRHLYHLSAVDLGLQPYRLLVSAGGGSPALRDKLLQFCEKQLSVVSFSVCFGSWDFELGVEVSSGQEVVHLSELLRQLAGEAVHDLHLLPVFRQGVSRGFMSFEGP